ncbi:FmdE family protein, partial [Methanobacterium alcaliphilum]|uniref:FmdE family protein n=1 Tax=Methanobacterium alcaliphilum TaxID=392018 RepID=UPI00200A3E44
AIFNMNATAAYKLGREVTKKANQLLNFTNADSVLCITTAGLTYWDGSTTEDCLEGILNEAKGLITYGQGNLLTLQRTRVDPVDFGFIINKNGALTIAYFVNGSLTPTYVGTISENMTSAQWNVLKTKLGNDAFPYASLANAWAIGLSSDILRQAAYHGHLCLGTISGQAMIETLLKYYPATNEYGLPLEGVSYNVVGVPGGSDDDSFTFAMDATTGKRAYVGINTTDNNMVGFIRWNSQSNTGTLIIMMYDEDEVVALFKSETGLSAYSSISSELKFNKWLVSKLETNPESLVKILYAFDNLTVEQLHYLMGYEPNKGSTTIEAHGLDMEYILNQTNLVAAVPANMTYTAGNFTADFFKQIGIDAANMAIELFKAMGIDIEKDSSLLTVFTSAGYVRFAGQSTDMVWDGVYEVLGSRLSRATLLPVHTALWKNLVFDFAYKNGTKVVTVAFEYNATSGELVQCNQNYNIEDVLLYDPPYDALMAWLWHNHVCGGSSPGYLLVDYIFENYPVGEDEKYIYVTTNDNCKDDILEYLLSVSAGAGTYYNLRLTSNDTKAENGSNVGILIKWNSKTNTGVAVIINWVAPKFASGSNSYEEYIKLYKGDYSSANLISAPIVSSYSTKPISSADLAAILAGGNALQYILGLPDVLPGTHNNGTTNTNGTTNNGGNHWVNNGGSTNNGGSSSNGGSNGGSHGGSSSFGGSSVGTSFVPVSAASQTTTEEAETGSSAPKAYEVSKASTSTDPNNSNWYIYGIVGVLALGALVGFGFMRGGISGKI